MTTRLLILHDSPDFGGHERMLLTWLPAILDTTTATICVPAANQRLVSALAPFADRLEIVTWPFIKRRGEPYLHWLRLRYRAAVRRLVASVKPDVVLLVQGRIENLSVPMAVLPRSVYVISYLPMAHTLTEMGRRVPFGDAFRRLLYARPDQFIVPSPAVARQVAAAGARSLATIVANVVPPQLRIEPEVARARLGLRGDRRVALFLGRLDHGQKGLDALCEAAQRARPGTLSEWSFVFAGDGPGASALKALGVKGVIDVHLAGWTDQPEVYLSAADVLLLPSRWEGLPLAMLEAMQLGVPILASSLDVFREALPAANVINFATVDLGAALDRAVANRDVFATHAAAYLRPLTLEAGERQFASALADGVR